MRITQGIMTGHLLQNLSRTLKELDRLEQQITTQKKVTKPSDDPVALEDAMRLRSGLAEIAQYQENAGAAISWMDLTESALMDIVTILHRVKEIATQGANGPNPPESRKAWAMEVEELAGELAQLANSSLSGRYIFAGTQTSTPPYDIETDTWSGDSRGIHYEVGPMVTIQVNTDGALIFNGAGSARPLFALLKDVVQNLRDDNIEELGKVRLAELEAALDNTLNYVSEIGAKQNRMQMTQQRLLEMDHNFQEILTKTEDIDMARTIIDLKSYEAAYQGALAAGARIIQPTLVDFLK